MIQVIHCAAFFLLMSSCSSLVPTTECIAKAKTGIRSVIEANSVNYLFPEYPFIAGFVRLAFHDCVGAGGCDGCINHRSAANAGLLRYTNKLDYAYTHGRHNCMSRADFYALAALVALEMATEPVNDKFTALKDNRFLVGRKDCSTSPSEDANDESFPDAKFNTDQTLAFFQRAFDLTPSEVVALVGAHTLGRCSVRNSGYEGKWVTGYTNGRANSDILDNKFYDSIDGVWKQVTVPGSGKIQWQVPLFPPNSGNENPLFQSPMFLNSDLSLAWNLSPVGSLGQVSCHIGPCFFGRCCPKSETNAKFREYATSNSKWLRDFTNVFLKMINLNGATLHAPKPGSKDAKEHGLRNEYVRRMMSDYIQNEVNDYAEDEVSDPIQDETNEWLK